MARTGYSGRDHHPIPLNHGAEDDSTHGAPLLPGFPGDPRRDNTDMLEHLRNLLQARRVDRDEAGASAVEYGLLVAGIAALIVAVVFVFGGMISDTFQDTCDTIVDGRPADAANANASCDGGTDG
jgi:pilus assembly protein Flp/PilA